MGRGGVAMCVGGCVRGGVGCVCVCVCEGVCVKVSGRACVVFLPSSECVYITSRSHCYNEIVNFNFSSRHH